MKIPRDALTTLAWEGRMTLQVPQYMIHFEGDGVDPAEKGEIEIPSDWIIELRDDTPCVGREEGFWYLSRKGFKAMKSALRRSWEKGRTRDKSPRGSWKKFEQEAETFFATVERKKAAKIKLLEDKLAKLRAFVV